MCDVWECKYCRKVFAMLPKVCEYDKVQLKKGKLSINLKRCEFYKKDV